jgi:hypothetical protein
MPNFVEFNNTRNGAVVHVPLGEQLELGFTFEAVRPHSYKASLLARGYAVCVIGRCLCAYRIAS